MFAGPPRFEELSSGLVSTAPDLLRFFCAMADGGAPVLTAGSVALMTADALTSPPPRMSRPRHRGLPGSERPLPPTTAAAAVRR
jgi:hypothetical protein